MMLQCNPRCKQSDGYTEGLLDVEENKVMCTKCGEELKSISDFTKTSMRLNGEVLKTKKKKAFVFKCLTCNKDVETATQNGVLVGKDCKNGQVGCKINITEHMIVAIQQMQTGKDNDEQE